MKIALERFKWKPAPWMKPENVNAIWLYCFNGKLEVEFELDENIQLNQSKHVAHSKNKNLPNLIEISDMKVLNVIKEDIDSLNVCGARGRGIILGEIEIPFGILKKRLIVLSTLNDWKDYLESKKFS